ncbi:MAG: NAD(+) synthase [Solirubrobacterales bacterium]|nr:NAD(+) synthase [Solirubrobacterales bacterium]
MSLDRSSARPAFGSLYSHGFARVRAAVPHLRIGEPAFNAERTVALARQAHEGHAALIAFPELGLSGYSIDDLLHQGALLDGVVEAIDRIAAESAALQPIILVGAPLRHEQGIFNCAVVVHRGRVLGVVPKSYLPEYKEYYEKRQFRAARDAVANHIRLLGSDVPFGADLLFVARDLPGFVLHVEVCEDLWVAIPPSTFGALAGATVLANLSASNITIGKAVFRRTLCSAQSARTISAYLYTAAGMGESTTDLAWDGQALICENGDLLTEAERFSTGEQVIGCDIDLDRLVADRASTSSYGDSIHDYRERLASMRRIELELGVETGPAVALQREVERFPYVPADPVSRNERCEEVYNIQVRGLETRLEATGIGKIVIGVSGGLDSTHALIVAARAVDRLGLPRENVLAYTMPGFATGERTLRNSHRLMETLGVSSAELDIRPSATQMLRDLQHPAAEGADQYDVTYENVQAGERTSHLFRLANYHGALVLGTGDLSELALGWATYGVGDQMSHYHVNASVPKTLIQFMVRWAIDTDQFGADVNDVLDSVLNTEISPELVPSSGENGDELQGSEKVVGPYELQDFFLYYTLRFGYPPAKVAFLALRAWGDRSAGTWPDLIPEERRNEYALEEIKHWLGVFLERFFHISQFKRSAMPNAPKVGSGGSLSPRGDWRAPSDGSAVTWLEQLRATVPDSL